MQSLRLCNCSCRPGIPDRLTIFPYPLNPATLLLMLCICLLFTSPAVAGDKSGNSVAVFDFESERGMYKDAATFLTESIRSELAKSGQYQVMERSLMESILSKHSFYMTRDLIVEYAVEAGRALKAGTVVIGYVSKKNDTYYLTLSRIKVATGTVDLIVEDKCAVGKEDLARLSGTVSAKLLGEVKVVRLRQARAENKRFVMSALSISDETSGLAWLRDSNSAGATMTWEAANEYVDHLNIQDYAGRRDWRLPSKSELETLVAYAKTEGVVKNINELFAKIGFKNMQAENYWSATDDEKMVGLVWVLDLYGGTMSTAGKGGTLYVWPVRGTLNPAAVNPK